jgi:hypothetical protein
MKTMAFNMAGKLPQKMSRNRRLDSSTILTLIKKAPEKFLRSFFNPGAEGQNRTAGTGIFRPTF